jgi:pimeloyl-ACP methyl ester carboxylesterase
MGLFFLACQPKEADKKVEEKSLIDLGGEKQYVEIIGTSSKKPVLLFIHGGPGWPQTPLLRYFNADLCKDFIVATWDQRGCGLSYQHNPKAKNISLEQITQDAHELTKLLKQKFKQDKIFLMGYSWGSMVGIKLVERYPEDYQAYIGAGQVVNLKKSLQVTRQWLREQASNANDSVTLKGLMALEEPGACKSEFDCFFQQYQFVEKYRGAVYDTCIVAKVNEALISYPDYKDYDWNKGFDYSVKFLEKDLFNPFIDEIKELKVPVYFFLGRHDWNVPSVLAADFLKTLKAPYKEVVWFENSAHELLEEEAEKVNELLVKKLIR